MFSKIVTVTVCLGACACTLLALRQARLQAANELAEARLRVRRIDEQVSLIRASIAPQITPEHVEEMTGEIGPRLGPLVPAGADDLADLERDDAETVADGRLLLTSDADGDSP